MFIRSIREKICYALLMRLLSCCEEFLPTANHGDDRQKVIDLTRRARDLANAVDAAANAGDWQVVPALETRRQEIDEELRDAIQGELAQLEAEELRKVIGRPNAPRQQGNRLFAVQARLNFAFANLYIRLSADQKR